MSEKTTVEVTAGLIFCQGRVLISRRPPEKRHGGYWEFPGGKRESGESLEQCLIREIREELAMEIDIDRPLPPVNHNYEDSKIKLYGFLCRFLSGRPRPEPGRAWAWVTLEQLTEYDLLPPDRRLARSLISSPGGSR